MLRRDVESIKVAECVNNRAHIFLTLNYNIITTYLSVRLALIRSLMMERGWLGILNSFLSIRWMTLLGTLVY